MNSSRDGSAKCFACYLLEESSQHLDYPIELALMTDCRFGTEKERSGANKSLLVSGVVMDDPRRGFLTFS